MNGGARSRRLLAVGGMMVAACASSPTEQDHAGADGASSERSVSMLVRDSAVEVEELVEAGWQRLTAELGLLKPRHIVAYRGYGNDAQLWVIGRLLANDEYPGPEDDDGWWDNLLATYSRRNTHEVAHARIELHHGEHRRVVRTDTT